MKLPFSLQTSKAFKFNNPTSIPFCGQIKTSIPFKFFSKFCHQISFPRTATQLNHLLNSATHHKSPKHATQIHAHIITTNHFHLPFLFNNLLALYSKCGHINQSLKLFKTIHDESKNIVTWTSLITQLSHLNKPLQALTYFNQMRCTGTSPNQFTFSAILPACAHTMIITHGEQVHSLILKHGFETHIFVGSALVDMYAKCLDMSSAGKVFDEMPLRTLVSWNTMIVGFLSNRLYDRAVGVFREVVGETFLGLDQVTVSSVLSACANLADVEFGKQVHGVIVKHGLTELLYVKNSLMDMYSKCGLLGDAVWLFHTIRERDVVSWNVMMMGCIHNNDFDEACNHFWSMREEGIFPDEASYSSALHASAVLSALNKGMLIHELILKSGVLGFVSVVSSLIMMYAKCGTLIDARRVFEEAENCNVVCWTALIAACHQHGHANEAIKVFEEMLQDGIRPEYVTFVSVLSACSHGNHIEAGFKYFNSMTKDHNIEPGPEHYACMVDLLGRSGRLDEAKSFITSMPITPNPSVWGALLGACRKFGNVEMGKEVAEKLFQLEPHNPGNYVLLYNMYACNGLLEEANEVRRLMSINGVRKESGCSWD